MRTAVRTSRVTQQVSFSRTSSKHSCRCSVVLYIESSSNVQMMFLASFLVCMRSHMSSQRRDLKMKSSAEPISGMSRFQPTPSHHKHAHAKINNHPRGVRADKMKGVACTSTQTEPPPTARTGLAPPRRHRDSMTAGSILVSPPLKLPELSPVAPSPSKPSKRTSAPTDGPRKCSFVVVDGTTDKATAVKTSRRSSVPLPRTAVLPGASRPLLRRRSGDFSLPVRYKVRRKNRQHAEKERRKGRTAVHMQITCCRLTVKTSSRQMLCYLIVR